MSDLVTGALLLGCLFVVPVWNFARSVVEYFEFWNDYILLCDGSKVYWARHDFLTMWIMSCREGGKGK